MSSWTLSCPLKFERDTEKLFMLRSMLIEITFNSFPCFCLHDLQEAEGFISALI